MIQHQIEDGMFLRSRTAAGASGVSGSARGSILYIHGLGESGLCFEGLIRDPRLTAWHHLVPDLPGYGRSAWTAAPMGLEEHAERLGRWLQARGGEPVVVLGHSMGGVLGLFLCERFPEQVRAFCNVEGNLSIHDCHFSSKVAALSPEDLLAGGFETLLANIYQDGLKDLPLRSYYASMRFCDPQVHHRNSTELVAFSTGESGAARLAALPMPRTYILGSPRGTGEHSQSLLRAEGITPRVIDHAGHWPFLDQPEAFLEALAAFLEEITPRKD